MRRLTAVLAVVALVLVQPGLFLASAKAKSVRVVQIEVYLSSQTMAVDVDGWSRGRWKASTAREG